MKQRPLRLIRFGRSPDPSPIRRITTREMPHVFATFELVISRDGQVVRRLRPVPGGFAEITL